MARQEALSGAKQVHVFEKKPQSTIKYPKCNKFLNFRELSLARQEALSGAKQVPKVH